MGGPNWKASLGTGALMLSPTIVYLVLVAWYLGRQVHVVIFIIRCAPMGGSARAHTHPARLRHSKQFF